MRYVWILLLLAVNAYSFTYNVTQDVFTVNTSTSQPAKGEKRCDLTFGTTFYRITDSTTEVGDNHCMVVYSRFTPANCDQTRLFLQRTNGWDDGVIFDATTPWAKYKILPTTCTIDDVPEQNFVTLESGECRWTPDNPDEFYLVGNMNVMNGMALYRYNVVTNTATVVRDFSSDWPTSDHIKNDVEGAPSDDGRYWVFMVMGAYTGSQYPIDAIITYDIETDVILGTMTYTTYQGLGGQRASLPRPNMVDVAPDGSCWLALWPRCWDDRSYEPDSDLYADIGTVFDGPHVFDFDMTNPVKVSVDQTHGGWGYMYDGTLVYVSQNNRQDYLEFRKVSDGTAYQIIDHSELGWGNGFHFARMPSTRPGWILCSTYSGEDGSVSDWGDNQLLMFELVDKTTTTLNVWRLGHTYNMANEYYSEGFAAMDYAGDKIWWSAKWFGQNDVDTYEMQLPTDWYRNASSGVQVNPPGDGEDDGGGIGGGGGAGGGSTENFGNTSEGASWDNQTASQATLAKVTSVSAGTLNTIKAYCKSQYDTATFSCAIYDDSGGPNNKLGETDEVEVTTSASWVTFTLASGVSISAATTYHIGIWSDGSSDNTQIAYDAGSSGDGLDNTGNTFNTWPDPWSGSDRDRDRVYSLYGVVTLPGSGKSDVPVDAIETGVLMLQ